MSYLRWMRERQLQVGAVLMALVACAEPPSSPDIAALAATGSGDPTVRSVVPGDAPQNTTLDITVGGSGFDRGSKVTLELNSAPAAGITTNSTTFVNAKQLIANVTISATAAPTRYDVAVTTSTGKRGIGAERFEVIELLDLGVLAGNQTIWGSAVNGQGHVFGMVYPSPFFWTRGGGLEAVQPGLEGMPTDMNDQDQAVGTTCGLPPPQDPLAPYCTSYGVLWRRDAGGWTATRVTGDNGFTYGINNLGQIFGDDPGPTRWTISGSGFIREAMPVPAGRANPKAYRGNNTGQVVGDDVFWSFETTGSITTMLVPAPPAGSSPALIDLADLNATGEVVAVGSALIGGNRKPVRWVFRRGGGVWQATSIEVLPSPIKSFSGLAKAVNNAGEAVGSVYDMGGVSHPVRWPRGGSPTMLPHPKGHHSGAYDINDAGEVTGFYSDKSGGNHAAFWPRP